MAAARSTFAAVFLGVAYTCLWAAPVGLIAIAVIWGNLTHMQKLNLEGIATAAKISSGHLQTGKYNSQITSVTFNINWIDDKKQAHYAQNVDVSTDYALGFIYIPNRLLPNIYEIKINSLPIKYLSSDPSKFLVYRDPANSEGAEKGKLILAIAITAFAIAFPSIYFSLRRRKRQNI